MCSRYGMEARTVFNMRSTISRRPSPISLLQLGLTLPGRASKRPGQFALASIWRKAKQARLAHREYPRPLDLDSISSMQLCEL